MKDNPQQIELLLDEWADGSLSEEQISELRELLRESSKARTQYVQWQILNAALTMEAGSLPIDDVKPSLAPAASNRRWAWKSVLMIAASIAFLAVATRWAYLELKTDEVVQQADSESSADPQEPTSQGIALVTRLVNAEWEIENQVIDVGKALTPGQLKLRSGYAQIEFFCGATVVLEGPAELELVSSTAAKFVKGRLRAQVPPAARGFQIDVDGMKVVDLGTEFGLSVSPEGSEVQVFDGEVELLRSDTQKKLIKSGEAVAHEAGVFSDTEITPEQYVDLAALDHRADDQTIARFRRWQEYSKELRNDPRLIAYYALDQSDRWQRKLKNSMLPESAELDGAIVGARRVSGRWGKGALEFKQPGDRVRVNIPGEFRSLTFACWVKIDSLDRWYNSLFLTDNYQRGEPHWQILDTGQLFFSVRVSDDRRGPEHKEVLSPPFWNPTLSGKWLHLATTYDVDAQQTTHYLNGEQLIQETIPDFQLVQKTRIGMASIGNWSMPTKPDAHFAIRNLNGCIDEFAIFADALSAEEIAEMYEHGNP